MATRRDKTENKKWLRSIQRLGLMPTQRLSEHDTLAWIQELYEWSCVGGYAHIVVDDGNVENEHIEWAINNALHGERVSHWPHEVLRLSLIVLINLRLMPYRQRKRLYELNWHHKHRATLKSQSVPIDPLANMALAGVLLPAGSTPEAWERWHELLPSDSLFKGAILLR